MKLDFAVMETQAVLRKEAEARAKFAELKGFAPTIPNQHILVSAIASFSRSNHSIFQFLVWFLFSVRGAI
jgi:hypothetical protein